MACSLHSLLLPPSLPFPASLLQHLSFSSFPTTSHHSAAHSSEENSQTGFQRMEEEGEGRRKRRSSAWVWGLQLITLILEEEEAVEQEQDRQADRLEQTPPAHGIAPWQQPHPCTVSLACKTAALHLQHLPALYEEGREAFLCLCVKRLLPPFCGRKDGTFCAANSCLPSGLCLASVKFNLEENHGPENTQLGSLLPLGLLTKH